MRCALALLLLAGCAHEVREGFYACADGSECPTGWSCRGDGRCWSTPGGDAGTDASADAAAGDACAPEARPVDLLLMVDDSHSMGEEQAALTASFPELVRALATGDVEPDGTLDFDPVSDLHVGVVTSDMGTGGFVLPTCANAEVGDDGLLRTRGAPGCAATYPPFLAYAPGGALAQFRADFACVATAGTEGCGLEQQLEAVLKALTPSGSSLRFVNDTRGHGDAENAGFLRPESVLVLLLVTDEDDCSASDPAIFDPSAPAYASTGLNLRCSQYPAALHGIARYADGLRALRPGHPERLVFAAITGVPLAVEEQAYSAILADALMQNRIDTSGTGLEPACMGGGGQAYPARRITQTAQELSVLGSATLVRSICRPDLIDPLRDLLARIEPQLTPICR